MYRYISQFKRNPVAIEKKWIFSLPMGFKLVFFPSNERKISITLFEKLLKNACSPVSSSVRRILDFIFRGNVC